MLSTNTSSAHSSHQTHIAASVAMPMPIGHSFASPPRHRSTTPPPPQHLPNLSRHSRASSCASLLFDLETDEWEGVEPSCPRLPVEMQRVLTSVEDKAEGLLWLNSLQAKQALTASDDPAATCDVREFAQALANQGHMVWLRNGTYACPPDSGLGTIKHTFVVASLQGDSASQPTYCVVDPNWQEHFKLSGVGTDHYKQLLNLLPGVFVGCANKLAQLVNLLCKEMDKVFQLRGVSLPPWRSARVMQGRWLVNQAEDEHVPQAPSSINAQRSLSGPLPAAATLPGVSV